MSVPAAVPFTPFLLPADDSLLPTCTVTFVAADSHRPTTFLIHIQEVSAHPVPDELVRRQQAQDGPVLDRVQGANPGVELLRRQIDFKTIEAMFPGRWHHCGTPVRGGCGESVAGQ